MEGTTGKRYQKQRDKLRAAGGKVATVHLRYDAVAGIADIQRLLVESGAKGPITQNEAINHAILMFSWLLRTRGKWGDYEDDLIDYTIVNGSSFNNTMRRGIRMD